MIGASFAPWRAAWLGLDPIRALVDILELGLHPIRLSASWREIDAEGFGRLDDLLSLCESRGAGVILTVGMKAQGWPEFHLPGRIAVSAGPSIDAASLAPLRTGSLAFVRTVVGRYRDHPAIIAWQVENEPFNRSGPLDWWISRMFVRREIFEVRARVGRRPVVVTVFTAFNAGVDENSSRHHGMPRRPWHLPPQREALALLHRGDILGLDVYRAIGRQDGERSWVERAEPGPLWAANRWRRLAEEQGKHAWIMEAQAEPWEPPGGSMAKPQTVGPDDGPDLVHRLQACGFPTILLWGGEYWLWRAKEGDPGWLDAIRRDLTPSARSPLSRDPAPEPPVRAS